jgi:hypothetical protein
LQRLAKGCRLIEREEKTGDAVLHDCVVPWHPAGHDRFCAGHRFENGIGHSFVKRRIYEAMAGPANLAQLFALKPAVPNDVGRQMQVLRLSFQFGSQRAVAHEMDLELTRPLIS